MKTEEIIERLRHPQKYYKKKTNSRHSSDADPQTPPKRIHLISNLFSLVLLGGVIVGAAILFLATARVKNKAENLAASLDPAQIKGLSSEAEFNPNKDVTYVQITEGQDRNVSVNSLGMTLPIISRFNYQSITPSNYGIIGMAPWALSQNLAANIQDIELIRYLLNREEVCKAFIQRTDVAPLLEDPQLLAVFVQDESSLQDFFNQDTVKAVLANPLLVRTIAGSRFMSYLLTSKSLQYYRKHPQEALALIQANPKLRELQQNAGIQQAVKENYYLKSIADKLLSTPTPEKSAA